MDGHLHKAWKRTNTQNIKAWDAAGSVEASTKVAELGGCGSLRDDDRQVKEIMCQRELLVRELAMGRF